MRGLGWFAIAAVLMRGCTASATIARVQVAHAYPGNSASLTGTGAGHFLVLAYSYHATEGATSCTDGTDTWTNATKVENASAPTALEVWYAANIAGGNVTVTCTAESDGGVTLVEYSGVATSAPIDTFQGTVNASSGTAVTLTALTASSGDGVLAAYANEAGGGFASWASPFAAVHTDTGHIDAEGEDLNVAGGSIGASGTLSAANSEGTGMLVAFRAAAGPPASAPPCLLAAVGAAGCADTLAGTLTIDGASLAMAGAYTCAATGCTLALTGTIPAPGSAPAATGVAGVQVQMVAAASVACTSALPCLHEGPNGDILVQTIPGGAGHAFEILIGLPAALFAAIGSWAVGTENP